MRGRFVYILFLIFFAVCPVFAQEDTPTPTITPTPTPSSGCWDPAPGGTVELTSVVSAGPRSITLTWTDAVDPVSYYLLSYGLASGQYIYGNPDMGGQGTTSYTVGGLTTGKTYFFVVRAGNGCTPGTFSNELSAVAGESPTPTPGPTDTPTLTPTPETPTPDPSAGSGQAPTPSPEVLASETSSPTGESNSLVGYIMLGATAVGVLCAIIGAIIYWVSRTASNSR